MTMFIVLSNADTSSTSIYLSLVMLMIYMQCEQTFIDAGGSHDMGGVIVASVSLSVFLSVFSKESGLIYQSQWTYFMACPAWLSVLI